MSAAQLHVRAHVDSLLPPLKIGMREVGQTSSWLSACCWMQKQQPHLFICASVHVQMCTRVLRNFCAGVVVCTYDCCMYTAY